MNPLQLFLPSVDLRCDHADVDPEAQRAVLVVSTTTATATCPLCQQPSPRIHSRYHRTLADLPLAAMTVQLRLRVRKFFCGTSTCERRIFAERVPAVVAPSARRTVRLATAQTRLGLALGGIAAARLSSELGLPASTDTFLRLVRRVPLPAPGTPTIIGIDDWAIRKGRTYGTLIVDLERHRIIDVLADRTSDTVATWLQSQPQIQVVSRDRASAYAEGVHQGAPTAIQVADRFHLLQNLTDTLRAIFLPHAAAIRRAGRSEPPPITTVEIPPTMPVSPAHQERRDQRRADRLAQYTLVKALHDQCVQGPVIAAQTGLSVRTIRRWLKTEAFPERQPRPRQPSQLDPYKPYLLDRWNAGCYNGSQLYREIQARGYPGKAGTVLSYCVHLRRAQGIRHQRQPRGEPPASVVEAPPPLTAHSAVWLVVRDPAQLTPTEQEQRRQLMTVHLHVAAAITLADGFLAMTRGRQGDRLGAWLAQAAASGVPPLQRFAAGIQRDLAAVQAGLTLEWSTGPVEGHINRLKMIKRQMFGRAKLDLLARRLLLT